jgi:YD repeat-containing protein
LKNSFFIILFSFLFSGSSAQLISTKPAEINTGPVSFNPEVVKKNKIRSITIVMVDKPDGAVIIDKGATQGFEFDSLGRVSRYYYTILSSIKKEEVEVPPFRRRGKVIRPATTRIVDRYINDTIFTNLYYDPQGRLITKRLRSGDYYDAWYYEYNEQGKIRRETHCRETNASENKNEFKLGVQKILSTETFKYEALTPTQIHKKCFNDEEREYKKGIINYDAKGNKISERYDFIVSWMHQESTFEYTPAGLLSRYTFSNNESGEMKDEKTFEYNAQGTLIMERKLKDKKVLNEISYLFDENNNLVKSHINRDFKNASIGIVKYAYTFY